MKKSILFSLPLVATLLFSCARKKGTPVPVEEAADVASTALVSMAGQNAIGLKLTGNLSYDMIQRSFDLDGDYKVKSINTYTNNLSITNLNLSLGVIKLNQPINNLLGSATLSTTINYQTSYDGNPEYQPQGPLPFKGTIKANAYLKNGVAYFDHDQRCADFVNDFILYPMGISDDYQDSQDKKYFMNIPIDGIPSIGVNTLLMGLISSYSSNINEFLVDGQYFDTYTAKKISKTRYSLTAESDLIKYIYPSSSPFLKDDQFLITATVTYDANKGVEEIVVDADIDLDQTFKDVYGDYPYYSDLVNRYGDMDNISAKAKGQLKLTFSYGSKVKVTEIKDTSSYTIDILELTSSGGGKSSERMSVDSQTFMKYFSNIDRVQPRYMTFEYQNIGSTEPIHGSGYVDYNDGPVDLDATSQSVFSIIDSFRDPNQAEQILSSLLENSSLCACYVTQGSYHENTYECELQSVEGFYYHLVFDSYGNITYLYFSQGDVGLEIRASYAY